MNAEPAGQPTGAETFDFDVLSTGATEPTGLLSVPVSADLWTRQCRITTLDQQKACRPERVGRGNKHFQDVVQLSVYTCRKGGPRCCTKRVEVGKVAGTQHRRPHSDHQLTGGERGRYYDERTSTSHPAHLQASLTPATLLWIDLTSTQYR